MGFSAEGILSFVVFPIRDFLPRTFLALLPFLYESPCLGHSAVFPVKFSSYSQGPKMAVLALMLNLRWNGLNFSWPPQNMIQHGEGKLVA